MNERDKALESARPDRSERKRVPMHKRNLISFNTDPDYSYRLFNDKDGRLQRALEGGWELVESEANIGDPMVGKAKKLGKHVSMPVGNDTMGYLMRIKKEWYEDDQKEKQKLVDATESAMKPNKARNEYGEGLVTEKL